MKKLNRIKMIRKTPKNGKLLESFTKYCLEHPELRFWQALTCWSGYNYIVGARFRDQQSGCWAGEDTFYIE